MSKDWGYSHPGVFVRDFYKTLDFYQSLGIATHPRGKASISKEETTQKMLIFGREVPPGKPQDPTKPRESGLENIYIGDMQLEVLRAPAQRPEGESLAYGEGINHVCFDVPDIDGQTDKLTEKGLRIIFDLTRGEFRVEDYLDTREFGNIILSMRPLANQEAIEGSRRWKAGLGKGLVDWKFRGHGVVVADLDKTSEYYEMLGFADLQPEATLDTGTMTGVTVYGESPGTAVKARTRIAKIGPAIYEFIEPVEGEAIYKESLDRRGEGIIDLIFTTEHLDEDIARLDARGVPVILGGKPASGGSFAYFDTRPDGGDIMIKLEQAG